MLAGSHFFIHERPDEPLALIARALTAAPALPPRQTVAPAPLAIPA